MTASLHDRSVLVVGRASGIAHATVLALLAAGAKVAAAGRNEESLAAAYRSTDVTTAQVDLTDEGSVAALADRIQVDHVVSTASARGGGRSAPRPLDISFRPVGNTLPTAGS